MFLQERQLVQRQTHPLGHRVNGYGALDGEGGNIQGTEHLFHAGAVGRVVQQLRHLHQLHTVELVHGEGIEVVAALLAVAEDVHPSLFLGANAVQHFAIGDGAEIGIGGLAGLLAAQGANQLIGPRPTAHDGDGK